MSAQLQKDFDLKRLTSLLSEFEDGSGELYQIVVDAMRAAGEEAVFNIAANTPVGVTGELRASIASGEPVMRGDAVQVTISTPLPYGAAVEYGRAPGKAPMVRNLDGTFSAVPSLELWVKRVLGVPDADVPGVAFAIARRIKYKGTKGAHMFELGLAQAEPGINKILEKALDDIIRALGDTL